MLGLYLLGFLAAIVIARALKSTILKSQRSSFILEMPPYRWPTLQLPGIAAARPGQGFSAPRRYGDPCWLPLSLWVLAHLPLENGKAPDSRA